MTTPVRHAHQPEPRWRYYAGLAAEVVVLLLMVAVVLIAGSLVGPVPR